MAKQRELYLDNIPGVLILSMIFLCHVRIIAVGVPEDTFLAWLHHCFYFINPWYFYRSGMFYRQKGYSSPIKNSYLKLIKPWISYSLYAYCIQMLCVIVRREPVNIDVLFLSQLRGFATNGAIPWNQPLWFLVTLFLIRVIYICIEPFVKKYYIAIASLFFAYYFSTPGAYSTFWIGTTCMGIFFFAMGDILKNGQFNILVFLSAICVYLLRLPMNLCSLWDARLNLIGSDDNYFVVILCILAGIIMFNNIFKRYIEKRIPVLTYIGNHSIFFFGFHFPFVLILYFYILPHFNFSLPVAYIVSLILMGIYLLFGVFVYSGKAKQMLQSIIDKK